MRNAELPPIGLGSVGFARRPEAPSAGLVVPHGFLQVRVLLARQEAELVEDGEVLLRLGKVPEHQERLPPCGRSTRRSCDVRRMITSPRTPTPPTISSTSSARACTVAHT